MPESWYWFILLGLASFRLVRLIVTDKITYFIRRPFVEEIEEENELGEVETFIIIKGTGIRGWIGELLSCYWCTGVWVTGALFCSFLYLPLVGQPIVIIFAAAGVAGIIESVISRVST